MPDSKEPADPTPAAPAKVKTPPAPQLSVRTYIETSSVKRKEADILRLAHASEKHTQADWDALAASYKGTEQ